jgi:DNA-binding transcriptional MerR regulator
LQTFTLFLDMPVSLKEENQKLFYSISEVAELLELNASTIRFWEKEFKALQPKKTQKGNRQFTKKDIELIQRISFLVKEKGYTIQGAKDQLKTRESQRENSEETEVIKKLQAIRRKLLELKKNLD